MIGNKKIIFIIPFIVIIFIGYIFYKYFTFQHYFRSYINSETSTFYARSILSFKDNYSYNDITTESYLKFLFELYSFEPKKKQFLKEQLFIKNKKYADFTIIDIYYKGEDYESSSSIYICELDNAFPTFPQYLIASKEYDILVFRIVLSND